MTQQGPVTFNYKWVVFNPTNVCMSFLTDYHMVLLFTILMEFVWITDLNIERYDHADHRII